MIRGRPARSLLLTPLMVGLGSVASLSAADWPQWRGPNRDGKSAETGLLKTWPEGGPKLLWTARDCGFGYGDVSVVGEDLFVLGKLKEGECLIKLGSAGKAVSKVVIDGAANKYLTGWGDGGRCSPTVDGDQIFCLTSDGTLAAINRASMTETWKVSLATKYPSKVNPWWGYSESPLVDGEKVAVTAGGAHGVVAFDRNTGKELWKGGTGEPQQYSSLMPMEVEGTRMYVTQGMKSLFAVDASSGKLLWSFGEIGRRVAVIPTPIIKGNRVYITAGYGSGCECVDIVKDGDKFTAKKVYVNQNMINHHGNVIELENHIFGFSDGPNGWTCQKLTDGESAWKKRDREAGKGSIRYADDRFYCFEEKKGGSCILIEASTKGFKEVGRLKLPENSKLDRKQGAVWSHPVIANGKLYLRDLDLLFCFDISGK